MAEHRVFSYEGELKVKEVYVDVFGDTRIELDEDCVFTQSDLDQAWEDGYQEAEDEAEDREAEYSFDEVAVHKAFRKLYLINLRENREDLKEILDLLEESDIINNYTYQHVSIKI